MRPQPDEIIHFRGATARSFAGEKHGGKMRSVHDPFSTTNLRQCGYQAQSDKPVVQKVEKRYPPDKSLSIGFASVYPLDSDLSGG